MRMTIEQLQEMEQKLDRDVTLRNEELKQRESAVHEAQELIAELRQKESQMSDSTVTRVCIYKYSLSLLGVNRFSISPKLVLYQ